MMAGAAEAAAELLRRVRARQSIAEFGRCVYPRFMDPPHVREICRHLEMLAEGRIKKLMVMAPPRHSKSVPASILFPAWYIGKYPTRQVIAVSYSEELATIFGRNVRNIIASEEFASLFPGVTLSKDVRGAGNWQTNEGGVYWSLGREGSITGKGANLLILDDMIKDMQDADNSSRMSRLVEHYESSIAVRLMPGASTLAIGTPWGRNDFLHRLLEKDGDWTLLKFPAIENEDTDHEKALWADWFSLEQLRYRRSQSSPRVWKSLYQQDPIPDSGTYFQSSWFDDTYKQQPDNLALYITADFAVTDKADAENPDFTEIAVWGIEPTKMNARDSIYEGTIYAIDWWYGQTAPDKWIDKFVELIAQYRVDACFLEAGVIRRSLEGIISTKMLAKRAYATMEWVSPVAEKTARARSFQALASAGRVKFPAISQWKPHVLGQLADFPGGRHDDAVDACSLIGLCVDKIRPRAEEMTHIPSRWTTKPVSGSWKTA